jgi:hypothetical protein
VTPPPASTAEDDTIAPFPESGPIDPGTYLVTGYPVPFEITVPDGWESGEGAGLGKGIAEEAVFLIFWPARYVPTDACAWQDALVEIDPTAEAFVDAMTTQTSTVSTAPVEVTVGDYSGFEFDYSREGDVAIEDCDQNRVCVHSDRADGCGHYYLADITGETYRVVDLNGERAVISVGQGTETNDPALTREARAVFDSIVFVRPDQ